MGDSFSGRFWGVGGEGTLISCKAEIKVSRTEQYEEKLHEREAQVWSSCWAAGPGMCSGEAG